MSYSQEEVSKIYEQFFEERMSQSTSRNITTKERDAQKYAIKNTTLFFFREKLVKDKREVWSKIYASHVARKAGLEISPEVASKVISADQSWKKSSGHAFEEVVKEMATDCVKDVDIEVVLQREAKEMIEAGKIRNEQRDITWLSSQIVGSVFDLFVIKSNYIFGCVQAKTSIRDRVTRDREPSAIAMNHFFWSIAFVLDGDFLKLPKFQHMVNGESAEFSQNGWHGMYAFSLPNEQINQRIHQLNPNMSPFKEHAKQAAEDWTQQRQWFTADWKPKP